MRTLMLAALVLAPSISLAQNAEKRHIVTITSAQLKGGVVSEITWDGGVIVLQGVFANPDGSLNPQYWVTPLDGVRLEERTSHTDASAKYWEMKARAVSPTGLGKIAISTDESLPMYGIGSLQRRVNDNVDHGGTQKRHIVKLGTAILYERTGGPPPYEGEVWGWSTPELNRVAYVDKNGDLWIARADGNSRTRILKGNFLLPAWSDDGRQIAVAEVKGRGEKWDIFIVTIPPHLLK
jgi:hypothetical protein